MPAWSQCCANATHMPGQRALDMGEDPHEHFHIRFMCFRSTALPHIDGFLKNHAQKYAPALKVSCPWDVMAALATPARPAARAVHPAVVMRRGSEPSLALWSADATVTRECQQLHPTESPLNGPRPRLLHGLADPGPVRGEPAAGHVGAGRHQEGGPYRGLEDGAVLRMWLCPFDTSMVGVCAI